MNHFDLPDLLALQNKCVTREDEEYFFAISLHPLLLGCCVNLGVGGLL